MVYHHIIQVSPERTASTLLVNILYGLFCPTLPVTYIAGIKRLRYFREEKPLPLIIKTHLMHFDEWKENIDSPLFVCSERKEIDRVLPKGSKRREDIIVFQYEELLREDVVEYVAKRVKEFFPTAELSIEEAIKRVKGMNEKIEEMKELEFVEYEEFYGVHGHHRNRDGMRKKDRKVTPEA